jgi:ornithine cyclodeaminase/alanine dehydrogenase-like protein (mu-crystallin family)
MTLYLDRDQVRQHLHMDQLIPAMKQALIEFSLGISRQPVRTMIPVDIRTAGRVPEQGFLATMPASAQGLGVKIVTFYPSNAELGLPTHMATIFLLDPATGAPLAVMDGGLITELRTAAVSAVATDCLASPEARVLAVLGSGVQARSHLEALALVRDFSQIRIWSRNDDHARQLANEVGGVAISAREAVEGADVVVTVTSSKMPVLKGEWLKPGCHVNAVGACRPDWRELDDRVMTNCVFVDSLEAASLESGDVILSGAQVEAELGAILVNDDSRYTHQTTIFKSLGMAVEDISAALLVYNAAMREPGGKH